MQTIQLPAVGERIGVQCGPGERAKDYAGIVIAIIASKWGDSALVLMDDGTTKRCDQLNTGPGIGWHRV
jgi:hypothetical protein